MTSQSFDKYHFHDNFIHGVSFVVENFQSELRFDIDHILDWPNCADKNNNGSDFTLSKGLLRFCDVTDLLINIEWGRSGYTTAVSGMSIDHIEREEVSTTLRFPSYYKWDIVLTDGRSLISFGASSMFLDLMGSPILVDRQFLMEAERAR